MSQSNHRPGDLVRLYAFRCGWTIAKHNVLVEGETDQRYAHLASRLYEGETGCSLVGRDLAVFPTGIGDAGGTYGIQRELPTLQNLANRDFDEDGRRVFRFAALVDSDPAGKQATRALTGKHTTLVENRDVFLIQRIMPRDTRDPGRLKKLIEERNEGCKSLDCEIEDLLPYDLLETFVESNANVLKRLGGRKNPVRTTDGHHFEFEIAVKGRLCRFVEDNALLEDVSGVIELLRSMRYYMGLDPDGVR